MNEILLAALSYLKSGLSILPADNDKMPKVKQWSHLQEQAATAEQVKKWFSTNNTNIAMICGKVSGNALMLDFDCYAEALSTFSGYVQEQAPGLLERLLTEKSPHGAHLGCRVDGPVLGNTKLARKPVPVEGPGHHQYRGGRPLEAIQVNGQWIITPAIIETRGEGGYCLIAPSKGYELTHGDYNHLPVITVDEMSILLECARACNEFHPPLETGYKQASSSEKLPGQDYDERGDIRHLLEKHGWRSKGSGHDGRERWMRPGKDQGHSATLTDGKVFYVFSQNAHPFDAPKAYGPFGVYTILEHGGDFKAATKALSAHGYGSKQEKPHIKQSGRLPTFMNVKEMQSEFGREIEWLWRDLIPKGNPVLFAGREKEGKSSTVAQISKEIVLSDPRALIMWVACEGFVSDHADKWTKLRMPNQVVMLRDNNGVYKLQLDNWKDQQFLDQSIEALKAHGQVLMVVIDSIRGMQSMGENDPKIASVMSAVNSIVCDKHKASCAYIAHHKKGKEESRRDKVAGSTAITSSVRAVYTVERVSECICRISPDQSNTLGHNATTYRSVLIEEEDGSFEISITPEVDQEEMGAVARAEKFLISLFRVKEEYETRKEIYDIAPKYGISERSIKRARGNLPIKFYRKVIPGPWFWSCSLYTQNHGLLEETQKNVGEKPNDIHNNTKEANNSGGNSKEANNTNNTKETKEEPEWSSWKKDNDIKTVSKNISHITENTKRDIEIVDVEESPFH
jgi:hypothetical protein